LNIEVLKYCYKTSFSTANSLGKRDALDLRGDYLIHRHTYIHMYIHTYIPTYIHAGIHTYIYKYYIPRNNMPAKRPVDSFKIITKSYKQNIFI